MSGHWIHRKQHVYNGFTCRSNAKRRIFILGPKILACFPALLTIDL